MWVLRAEQKLSPHSAQELGTGAVGPLGTPAIAWLEATSWGL